MGHQRLGLFYRVGLITWIITNAFFVPIEPRNPARSINLQDIGGLYDHLRNTLAAQSLAPNKSLAFETSESIANGGKCEDDGSGDQATGRNENAQELDESKYPISGGTHVVGRDPANRGIECGRRRADSE